MGFWYRVSGLLQKVPKTTVYATRINHKTETLSSNIWARSNSPSSLPKWGQKANTFKIIVHIIYHQYKYSLKALNNLNLRISDKRILADFYTNRRIEKTNENTRLTRAEYLEKCGERKNNRAREFRQLMKNNGWTRAGLARHLGFNRAWVSKVLNAEE